MLNRDSFGIYFTLNLPPLQSNLQHEFVYNIIGKENYNQITANLDLLLKRFNEVRHFRCSSHEVCWRQAKQRFLLAVLLTGWRTLVFWTARACYATSFRPMKELSKQSINRPTNQKKLFSRNQRRVRLDRKNLKINQSDGSLWSCVISMDFSVRTVLFLERKKNCAFRGWHELYFLSLRSAELKIIISEGDKLTTNSRGSRQQ